MRAARLARGLGQNDIAVACDVTRAAVSCWELGENAPSTNYVQLAAQALEVPGEWLLTGGGPPPDLKKKRRDVTLRASELIPEYPNGVVLPDQQPRDFWRLPRGLVTEILLSSPEHLLFTRVVTNAMEPTLRYHDFALIDHSQASPLIDGLVYAVSYGFGMILRRLSATTDPDVLELRADKPGIAPLMIPRERLTIVGRCVAVFSTSV
jgi:transcriptional regulator with XRE-family HTH domain